jgi:hypothetical protein
MEAMKKDHCLTETAEALGVSKSGFHAHQHKEERIRRRQDKALVAAIKPLFVQARKTHSTSLRAGFTAVRASPAPCATPGTAAVRTASRA